MSTSGSGSRSAVVLELAEEFLDRYRKGERPPLKEYTDQHPDLAAEIREVFPAMAMMERIALADDSLETTGEHRPAPLIPFEQLGDYRLIREVGHGGMGVVYEAEQVSLGRHVALKILPSHMVRDPLHKRRFEREAKAAAKLHHTNIVPVFGVGDHGGTPYYVMQFIQGLGLDDVLDELKRMRARPGVASSTTAASPSEKAPRNDATAADIARSLMTGKFAQSDAFDSDQHVTRTARAAADPGPDSLPSPLPPDPNPPADSSRLSASSVSLLTPGHTGDGRVKSRRQTFSQGVARIGVQVADALAYSHAQGILHRDIKPSNLLLDNRGSVWVTDFGLAKAEDQQNLTHTGDILGTLRYMPPEAFEKRTDARGDVYSLGLTLYELLAFRPAFDEHDRARLIKQVTDDDPPRLRKLNPEIPRDLETIVHKAIERNPAHRYPSASDLSADLQRFIDDEPIHARPVAFWERLAKWAKRRPAIAALGVLVHILGAVSLGVFIWSYSQINDSLTAARTARDRAQTLARNERHALGEAQAQTKVATGRTEALAWEDYINRVNRAYREVMDDNLALAEDLLHGCPPVRRGWEWHYVKRLANLARRTIDVAAASVNAVAFSPDGRQIASGASPPTFETGANKPPASVTLWNAETGGLRCNLGSVAGIIYGLALSPDGRRIAVGSGTRAPDTIARVTVWDAATGESAWAEEAAGTNAMCVAYSPDGTLLAVGHGLYSNLTAGTVVLRDAESGREVASFPGPIGGVNDLAFHPDGRHLAVAGAELVEVWDIETRARVLELKGHRQWVYAVAYSPDGKWLASGGWDRTIKLRDAATGDERLTIFAHEGFTLDLAFSRDGRTLASASEDRSARLWEVPSGRHLGTLHGHSDFVMAVAFRSDGREVATGSMDGSVRLWDLRACLPVVVEHDGVVERLAYRRDGLRVASQPYPYAGGFLPTQVWDPRTGEADVAAPGLDMTKAVQGEDYVPASAGRIVSPNGDRTAEIANDPGWSFATRSRVYNVVVIRDSSSGRALHTLVGHSAQISAATFSPDGTRLATASADRTIKLWDTATGREVFTLIGHTASVDCVVFSPDGRRIVSGGTDNTARVWNATPLPPEILEDHDARAGRKQALLHELKEEGESARRAEALEQIGNQQRAIAAWEQAVQESPDRLDLWFRHANALQHTGDAGGLLRLAEAARARFGRRTDPESIRRLAAIFALVTEPGWAAAAWSRAVEQAPDNVELRATLAQALHSACDFEALRRLADDLHERFGDTLTGPDLLRRADIDARAGRWDRAARDYARAAAERPDNPYGRAWQLTALHEAGDADAARCAAADLLEQFGDSEVASKALIALRYAVLLPDIDPQALLRLAEAAVARLTEPQWKSLTTPLGAALFRAGRLEEAAQALEEVARDAGENPVPIAWAFLAMTHHRLGHSEQARFWLEKLRGYRPNSTHYWIFAAESRILLREAEALIDPAAKSPRGN